MSFVIMAKHPRWVDLDADEMRTIKGFTHLPRQDSSNGGVKDYIIHVSRDGKGRGEPILRGIFVRDLKEKKIMFEKSVKVHYIRFTTLDKQRGQDHASGARLTILAE